MAFIARWAASLLMAFFLWPVIFILWNGPDRDFGYTGGMVMMLFVQFISPKGLWIVPLAGGTLIAMAWQALASRKAGVIPS